MSLRRRAWAVRTVAYHTAYNTFARAAPRAAAAVQRLTRDTGRGRGREGADAADYFEAVLADYYVIAEASGIGDRSLFRGKHVLELGPGDTRSLALLTRLDGASAWEGFDTFDIQSRRQRYVDEIYRAILVGRNEKRSALALLEGCEVHTTGASLRRSGRRFDVVLSRAVLEHVRDLRGLFEIASAVAKEDAVWIHKIDLRDHGMHHDHALDFLRFPDAAWRAMSSHIDLPNRERANVYLTLGERSGLRTIWAATTHVIDHGDVEQVRRELASPFREASADELCVLGLWLVQVGPRNPLKNVQPVTLMPAPHQRLSRY